MYLHFEYFVFPTRYHPLSIRTPVYSIHL